MQQAINAASNGDIVTIINLIETNQLQPREKQLSKCLHYAACGGHISVVRYLIDQGANIPRTCVGIVVEDGHLAVVETFLAAGWNINSEPVIKYALKSTEDMRTLLDFGADPNLFDERHGNCALDVASGYYDVDTIIFLLDNRTDVHCGSALHAAMERKDEKWREIADLLIKRGADVNAPNFAQAPRRFQRLVGPPLKIAIRKRDVERVRYLLENGADPLATNNLGMTMMATAGYPSFEEVREIMEKWIEASPSST